MVFVHAEKPYQSKVAMRQSGISKINTMYDKRKSPFTYMRQVLRRKCAKLLCKCDKLFGSIHRHNFSRSFIEPDKV